MPAQRNWDPLKELITVQKRMNSLFETALARTDFETGEGLDTWSPVADVYETPQALVLCLELPGLSQDSIGLQLDGDELVVSGNREMTREREDEQFHRVERSYGKFSRSFLLPSTVERSSIEATYNDGLLHIRLKNKGGKQNQPIHVAIQ